MNYTVKDRFLKYVRIDTQADPYSETFPSTLKQLDLSRHLQEELKHMNIPFITNEAGYIYATLESNTNKSIPGVFFCAHMDTAPDCSGTHVKPLVHENYQGQSLVLPDDENEVLTTENHPLLLNKIGHDIITASGLTLLGSDDKSGVAVIMDALYQLVQNPDIIHGKVVALFTTDEEIGKGVAKVDTSLIDAAFGYTLDGGDLGSFENENFSADSAKLTIKGVSAHPGMAKGKMEHAIKIASEIVASLPKDYLTPETTEGKEGFIHPNKIEGKLESASIDFIIRDFQTEKLKEHADLLRSLSDRVLKNYPGSSYKLEIREQYRNMKDILDRNPHITQHAIDAMNIVGIDPKVGSIRGGTDGAMLTYMGLPCPNLFAGEQAIHSRHEWVSVQDMERAVDTVVEIIKLCAE